MAWSPDRTMAPTEGLPEHLRPSVDQVAGSGDPATTALTTFISGFADITLNLSKNTLIAAIYVVKPAAKISL